MDGLLAWAADVVGGESDPESPSPPAAAVPAVAADLRFSHEQREEIGRLDKRAGELQLGLQQLRQRLPPVNAAQRLPHLHAESLALQSALALELHAHSATRIQAEIRESSLQADIVAYTKALEATEQQAVDRASEVQELGKSLEELDQLERKLRKECGDLEKSLLAEDPVEASTGYLVLVNEALAWPSSVQREKDLELRFSDTCRTTCSQAGTTEKLVIERDALELRVEHAIETRRNPLMEGLAHTAKEIKIGLKHAVSDQKKTRVVSSRGAAAIGEEALRSEPL